ncbi:MFS transporter [Streptomyces polyrhachis]|uniref:MFS transporter n=1 Tax=Streptomyces polyrhachis TaxID=1282885 RepID=A0ABW2GBE1_9ACTN
MTTPSPHPRARLRRPAWAGRNYTLLSAAAVITGIGTSGALIASMFAVYEAGGSATDAGLVAAARTLPLVAFLLIGGAVADRFPRHRVMVAANTLNFLSQGLFGLLVVTGQAQLWQMALLSALGGVGQAFFAPAAEGMVLSSVGEGDAGRAFALFRLGMNGAHIGGAALGGALVAGVGPGWVLLLDAAAFALAGGLRAFLDVSGVPAREKSEGLVTDLRVGWREFVSRPWLWAIVLQFSVVNAVVAAAESVYGPLVAREHLGGAVPWGLALSAFGAGTVGGALLMMRWRPRRMLLVGILCVFPFALPTAALAVPVGARELAAVMFVSGVSIEVFGVTWMTALRQEIPEEKLSRVAAYDWFGSLAGVPLAAALAGPAMGVFGRGGALWGGAVVIVVLTAAVLCVPQVRRLERAPQAEGGIPARARPQPTVKEPPGGSGEGTASASVTG